jgi:hypothetical protein
LLVPFVTVSETTVFVTMAMRNPGAVCPQAETQAYTAQTARPASVTAPAKSAQFFFKVFMLFFDF